MTMRDLRKVAAKYGATIEDHSGDRELVLYADLPKGKVWKANGEYVIAGASFRGRGATAYVVDDMIERMEYGVEDLIEEDIEL